MAYAPDRVGPPPSYPEAPPAYAPETTRERYREGYVNDPNYGRVPERPYDRVPRRDVANDVREDFREEVTAGPYRFGTRHGILGILALFAALGLVLGILGFAAAFALDEAAEEAADNDGGNTADDVAAGASAIPAILVSLLPFLAAPVLALAWGAWTGHASREGRIGLLAGAVGGLLGPILTLLLTGIGFALGAGAANLNLANVDMPFGISPGWGSTIPYLFTGAGVLWLLANTIAGALGGWIVGSILDGRWTTRVDRRARYSRRTMRY